MKHSDWVSCKEQAASTYARSMAFYASVKGEYHNHQMLAAIGLLWAAEAAGMAGAAGIMSPCQRNRPLGV